MRVPTLPATFPRRIVLSALLALSCAATTGAQAFEGFRSPSNNIHCALEDAGMRCDIIEFNSAPPPKPASCGDADWGQGFFITPNGQKGERICYTDTVINDDWPVLSYGSVWERPGFTCTSTIDGMACTNAAGHEFMLSRARQELF